ncbi:hypothetical protein Pla163_18930 [Planctomycetes bacterium Pla163]|uniref:Uncharacterized protein n=1 Tax=Rohdeia mirabilis TaxID=2528008 RepID=A0A518CZX4_9BACT|nr:hypothetical protein Pla163_18930 [Planctomycetes bacterium Pla163]
MPIEIAVPLVRAFEIYALVGVLVGGLFAFRGAARVDPDAAGAPLGFKLLIWPAAAALWPWSVWRMVGSKQPPIQSDAHRRAAREVAP